MTSARISRVWGKIPLTITIFSLSLPAFAKYSGGSGTADDPFRIANAADLAQVYSTPSDRWKHFILVADVDLSGKTWNRGVFPDFSGTFNGNGHCIRHATITGDSRVGLFGLLTGNGTVKELSVTDVNVTGTAGLIGGLVGDNSGSVLNCCITGTVTTGATSGGLVGFNSGHVLNCYARCTVTGSQQATVGGLVGRNETEVSNCYSSGEVSGGYHIGGLVGSGEGNVGHSFWDIERSGCTSSAGGQGLGTARMKDVSTYLSAGWDFVGESGNGTSEIWQMAEGEYPVLSIFTGYLRPQLTGEGTPDDPYLISTAEELGSAAWYSPSACYRLVADMDLSGIRWSTAVIPRFSGAFDGNHLCLRNLTVTGGGYLGLFGILTGQVKDLSLTDVNVVGSGGRIGGLVGSNGGRVDGCCSAGAVTGSSSGTGGLVGLNAGHVSNSHTTCTVAGDGSSGGLVGANYRQVSNCYSEGAVAGVSSVGGLVGGNGGWVHNCYTTGAVSGDISIGGLVGENYRQVSNCYSEGAVAGNSSVGGLAGYNRFSEGEGVINCYSTGVVTGKDHAGGLVGYNLGSVRNSFWDIEAAGIAGGDGGTGLPTTPMKDPNTFLVAGWDLAGESKNGTSETWQIPDGGGYPKLNIFNGYRPPQLSGQGTPENPFLVSTSVELGAVAYDPTACYKLAANIDLAGIWWSMAVIPNFSGSFDGAGFTIGNLSIAGLGYLGLIGNLTGTVTDLGIVDVNLVGGSYVGALAGYNSSGVSHCYSSGRIVASRDYAGGLVGGNGGNVNNSYSKATVDGDNGIGGLVGTNADRGSVDRCYSTGVVTGYGGGLIGENRANSRSSPGITNSFWDMWTSGLITSAGGTGKTTAEMQRAKTFLEAGWDFVGETANGTEDIWWIFEGKDYPRLWWETAEQ